MNRTLTQYTSRIIATLVLVCTQVLAMAQETVEINQQEVKGWLQQNWLWVAGGVLLLILIIAFSRGSSNRRKSTTVIKDEYGNVKSVTTTEVRD